MVMKSLVKYIFIVLCILVSCQRPELEEVVVINPEVDASLGKATISFSVNVPVSEVSTKAMGDNPIVDIKNLYLIVFDENGYFVEACKAEFVGKNDETHGNHLNERKYTVTLSLTDQKRIVHFIANCPVDQIRYGNEYDVISNMYVTKGQEIETAYWYRVQVPYIMLKDDTVNLKDEIIEKFTCVPLLRNYSQVTVLRGVELTDEKFVLESFAVYNTIAIGTVAPYNKSRQGFQMFFDDEGLHTYDELLSYGFEGHALARATLDNTLVDESPENTDFIAPGNPFYMYERKISVRTDEEDKWDESPAHIIIKGRYQGSATSTYYKLDLVREVDGDNQYFNLLRNFKYIFTVNDVNGPGYSKLSDAMSNPAGNNLSGATDTQGFTNISDGSGRMFVSFADTTLVTSDNIKLRYKYIPNLQNSSVTANSNVSIRPAQVTGDVIKNLVGTTGPDADGWTTLEFSIQNVGSIKKQQEIKLHVSDNANLHKTIRFTLHRPFTMNVKCDPKKIYKGIAKEMCVKIGIPDDLTDNLFPLDFMIEVEKLSLGPDAKKGNNLPVETGKSLIPEKVGKQSFYYLYRMTEKSEYDLLPVVDGQKIIATDWLTSTVESASRVYVANKYFDDAEDNFLNVDKSFTGLSITPGVIFNGEGETADISFTMDSGDTGFSGRVVTVMLNGLVADNSVVLNGGSGFEAVSGGFKIRPTNSKVTISNLRTSTLDGNASFTVIEDSYVDATSAEATRRQGQFKNLDIEPDKIFSGVGRTAQISFSMDDSDPKYNSRSVFVRLEGLAKGSNFVITGGDEGETVAGGIMVNTTARDITLSGLVTTSNTNPVSFTVEEPCYATPEMIVVPREQYQFGLTINPDQIAMGVGQQVTVTLSRDSRDTDFISRELTVTLDGLETTDGLGELVITPTSNNPITLNLRTTSVTAAVKVTARTENYDYATATATAGRDWNQFRNLSINNGQAVLEGVGRTVSISFTKDADDNDFTSRIITVKLNGMSAGASLAITGGTYVEAVDGGFTVKPTANTVTVSSGIVTTFRNETEGTLSFTVEEPTYGSTTVTAERQKANFTGEFNGTLNGEKGQPVEYTFEIPQEGYTSGMVVNVEFDGLEFVNGKPNDLWTDKGSGKWEYRPNETYSETTINLKTTEAGTRTNSVTLSAEGFDTLTSEIEQRDKIVITIAPSAVIDLGTNNVNILRSISIGNAGTVTWEGVTFGSREEGNWWWPTTYYTIKFDKLVFTGTDINDNTQVTIVTSNGQNGTQRTTTTTIGELRGN